MILDRLLMFSLAQALTATGDTASTDVIDLAVARDMSVGDHPALKVLCRVGTTFTGTTGTLLVSVQGSVDNSAWTTMAISPTHALAALINGASLLNMDLPGPTGAQALPRYLRLLYTIGTAVMTAGTVNAGIILDRQRQLQYPSGITIAN